MDAYVCSAVRWRVELHRVASNAGLDFVAHVTYPVLEPKNAMSPKCQVTTFFTCDKNSVTLPLVEIRDNNFQNVYRQQRY